MAAPSCLLCSADQVESWYVDRWREYFRCATCRLIFVPHDYHLSSADEKAEYDLHQNSPHDPRYRRFLDRIFTAVHTRLAAGSRGLDFGCGPGPTLSVMFEEMGHRVEVYDQFYAANTAVLASRYDFVTASEVVEHFRDPSGELALMWSCVASGGLLAIMTKLALDQEAFARWHYKNDRTHVSFFLAETFIWLAAQWRADLSFVAQDVVLLERTS